MPIPTRFFTLIYTNNLPRLRKAQQIFHSGQTGSRPSRRTATQRTATIPTIQHLAATTKYSHEPSPTSATHARQLLQSAHDRLLACACTCPATRVSKANPSGIICGQSYASKSDGRPPLRLLATVLLLRPEIAHRFLEDVYRRGWTHLSGMTSFACVRARVSEGSEDGLLQDVQASVRYVGRAVKGWMGRAWTTD